MQSRIPIWLGFASLAVLVVAVVIAVIPPSPNTISFVPRAQAQAVPAVVIDPCFGNTSKSSVVINATATTQLVALSGTTSIYVCGFIVDDNSANPTVQFEYGTGATCGTGTTTLTGTLVLGTATAPTPIFAVPSAGTIMKAPSGNALCLVVGGSTPNIQGIVIYIQQ